MSDADDPGHDKPDEPGLVTKEEANRDFRKKSGESRRTFLQRCAENLQTRLKALGLPVTIHQAVKTNSIYLRHADFEVRIADHDLTRDIQLDRPGGSRYVLAIKGTTVSAQDVTNLLLKIVARHGR